MTIGLRTALTGMKHAPDTHAGLWHDVYMPGFRAAEGAPNLPAQDNAGEQLRQHLERVAGLGVPEGYRQAFEAREKLLRSFRGNHENGVTRCYTATGKGRMVTGLGAGSVTENQIALLRTWGVPYIPGSALKGLASSTAHRLGGETWKRATVDHAPGTDAGVLFGSTEWQGVVIFHDAWWIPEGTKLPLDLDVMTVHHPKYYSQGDPPMDWDEPNPVPFLTAQGSYLVALTGPRDWVELTFRWLEHALAHDGIGAKTHAGYGRMNLTKRLSDEEQRVQRFMNDLENLPAQHRGASTAPQHLEKLREGHGKDPLRAKSIAKELFRQDPAFWTKWGKDPARTDTQRESLALLEMIPAQPAATAPPVTSPEKTEVPRAAAPREARGWVLAEAWLTGKGKDERVHLRLSEKAYRCPLKDLNLKPELLEALRKATEAAPVPVEADVKESKGTFKIRPRQAPTS